jgi:hypothetical protein
MIIIGLLLGCKRASIGSRLHSAFVLSTYVHGHRSPQLHSQKYCVALVLRYGRLVAFTSVHLRRRGTATRSGYQQAASVLRHCWTLSRARSRPVLFYVDLLASNAVSTTIEQ